MDDNYNLDKVTEKAVDNIIFIRGVKNCVETTKKLINIQDKFSKLLVCVRDMNMERNIQRTERMVYKHESSRYKQ